MNVLIDTSVWSLAIRRKAENLSAAEKSIVEELTELIEEGRARMIGLVRQELLSGIKTSTQYEKVRRILREFPDESIATADYEAAAKASNDCRAKGIATSVSDMLICQIASSREWAVFTTDPDFKTYAKILPIRLHEPRR